MATSIHNYMAVSSIMGQASLPNCIGIVLANTREANATGPNSVIMPLRLFLGPNAGPGAHGSGAPSTILVERFVFSVPISMCSRKTNNQIVHDRLFVNPMTFKVLVASSSTIPTDHMYNPTYHYILLCVKMENGLLAISFYSLLLNFSRSSFLIRTSLLGYGSTVKAFRGFISLALSNISS